MFFACLVENKEQSKMAARYIDRHYSVKYMSAMKEFSILNVNK